jgi:hypothetical protein
MQEHSFIEDMQVRPRALFLLLFCFLFFFLVDECKAR